MDDIEVIELGDDGSFDIPTTVKINKFVDTYLDEMKPEDDEHKYPDATNVNLEAMKVKDSIQPGEYKIYKVDKKLVILLQLNSDEKLKEITFEDTVFKLKTENEKVYKITLSSESYKIQPKSAVCKVWQGYVSTTFDLL